METSTGTDGNVFITFVTIRLSGKVIPRTLPFDEIADKVTVPGDRMTTMFYRRDWEGNGLPAHRLLTGHPGDGHALTSCSTG